MFVYKIPFRNFWQKYNLFYIELYKKDYISVRFHNGILTQKMMLSIVPLIMIYTQATAKQKLIFINQFVMWTC